MDTGSSGRRSGAAAHTMGAEMCLWQKIIGEEVTATGRAAEASAGGPVFNQIYRSALIRWEEKLAG